MLCLWRDGLITTVSLTLCLWRDGLITPVSLTLCLWRDGLVTPGRQAGQKRLLFESIKQFGQVRVKWSTIQVVFSTTQKD